MAVATSVVVVFGGLLVADATGSAPALVAVGFAALFVGQSVLPDAPSPGTEPGWVGGLVLAGEFAAGLAWVLVADAVVAGDVPDLLGADTGVVLIFLAARANEPLVAHVVRGLLRERIRAAAGARSAELRGRVATDPADGGDVLRLAPGRLDPVAMTYREDVDSTLLGFGFVLLVLAVAAIALAQADVSAVERVLGLVVLGGAFVALLLAVGHLRSGGSAFTVGPSGLAVDDEDRFAWSDIAYLEVAGERVRIVATDAREVTLDVDDFDVSVERLLEVVGAWAPLEVRVR